MPTKTEDAHRIAREARVFARKAHRGGATGTKITYLALQETAQAIGIYGVDGWTIRKAMRLTVAELRLTGEFHLADFADAPGASATGRQRVERAAAARGWTAHKDHAVLDVWAYRKGSRYTRVCYDRHGRVVDVHTARWTVGQGHNDKAGRAVAYLRGDEASPGRATAIGA